MNNQQFRRLVLDQSTSAGAGTPPDASTARDGTAPKTLGSRQRANIPMTPRTVGGGPGYVDFARQLKQQQQQQQGEPAAKRFKSSAAPKGSRLAAGYQDRARTLRERTDDEIGDKERRVKALEEQYKLGQIDRDLFEKLRDEIIGGDVQNVHLVKGLDWKLLERVRRGEDVLAEKKDDERKEESEPNEEDVERELEQMEEQEVQPLQKAEKVRNGDMGPPSLSKPGKKRTRDEILRDMKAARAKSQEGNPAQQALGSRFKKVGAPVPNTSRIEKDERGRDVLITVDEHGNVKRKVRKDKTKDATANGLLMPDKDVKPLGMAVPAARTSKPEEEEDGDIFADAGSDYNPLGDMEEASDSASDSDVSEKGKDEPERVARRRRPSDSQSRSQSRSSTHSPRSASASSKSSRHSARSRSPHSPAHSSSKSKEPASVPRNYFSSTNDPSPHSTEQSRPANPLQDPAMLAALKRAAAIAAPLESETAGKRSEEAEKAERHRRMLASAQSDRDLEDMDLGFGGSRRGDEEEEYIPGGGKKQRKRGKKKTGDQ